ncbi:hypothetical protein WMY93_010065 [Mugilogobius chulae]|uniref:C2H2-type domain-containing protein n=1 Tax=Mugilogobius chulae TaxID=88201 RepID=A0AAW0PC10_9GOBI
MCKNGALKALVQERLTAAAEEIFALFERTIAEFEEELRRSKEENQRKQELLEAVLNPRVLIQQMVPGAGVKQEELPVPECTAAVWVTTEESLLQQTELREETQGEDFSTETHFHPKTESESSDTDNDDDWGPFSYSETAGDNDIQTCIVERSRSLRRHCAAPRGKPEETGAAGGCAKPESCAVRENVQIQPTSPGAGLNPGLNQDLETPQTQIKEEPEEPRVKQEEEQRPIPECTADACVNTEESSLLQQRQTELKEETRAEDFSTETLFHPETERESSDTDNDDDWEPFSCSEAAGDHNYSQIQPKSSGAGLKEEPKEPRVKQEEEQMLVPECTAAVSEELSLLQQTELKEETQGEDLSTETNFHLEIERESSDADNNDDWRLFNYSGAAGDNNYQTYIREETGAAGGCAKPESCAVQESVQIKPTSSGAGLNPGLNQDLETLQTQIKEEPEEPRVKQEEEQQPVPECTAAVCVNTEESSLLQQTELREETQGEDFSAETHFHPETERESSDTDNDDDWEPFSCSEAAGDNNSQTCVRDESSAEPALVQERLTAAADEIFALFERTIAEFEEELRRSKEENQRKQELLEAVLKPSPGAGLNPGLNQDLETLQTQIKEEPEEPRVKQEEEQRPVPECTAAVCVKTEESESVQIQPTSPGAGLDPGLNQDLETPQTQIKEEPEEPRVKQEEEQRPVPECPAVCVNTEDSSQFKSEGDSSDTDNDDDWGPFSCSEAAGDRNSPVQTRTRDTAAQNSLQNESEPETRAAVNKKDDSGTAKGAGKKMFQCSVCKKKVTTRFSLKEHLRVHTGEKPLAAKFVRSHLLAQVI